MARNHQDNFATNLTSNQLAGVTTTPLNSIPSIDAPFYIALDATNINGHYEVVDVTSKTATNINHAATTYAHTTAETVSLVVPAVEMDGVVNSAGSTATPAEIAPTGTDSNIWMGIQGKGTGKIEVELPYGSANVTSTSTTSLTFVDVTDSSFSFTIKKTSHVKIFFTGNVQNNTAAGYFVLGIARDGGNLVSATIQVAQAGISKRETLLHVDASLAPGTYTYKLQIAAQTGGHTVVCTAGTIFAEAIIA